MKDYLHKNGKKSNRKSLKIYLVTTCRRADYEGCSYDAHEISTAFFSKEIAENEIVKELRHALESDVTVETLSDYSSNHYYEYGWCYSIEEIEVSDNNKLR